MYVSVHHVPACLVCDLMYSCLATPEATTMNAGLVAGIVVAVVVIVVIVAAVAVVARQRSQSTKPEVR